MNRPGSNRTPAERAEDAMLEAARAKTEARTKRKLADRTLDRIFLAEQGAVEIRKAKARIHERYISVDDAAMEAENAHILAQAGADAEQVAFEEWRTNEATRRQDSKFIAAQR